ARHRAQAARARPSPAGRPADRLTGGRSGKLPRISGHRLARVGLVRGRRTRSTDLLFVLVPTLTPIRTKGRPDGFSFRGKGPGAGTEARTAGGPAARPGGRTAGRPGPGKPTPPPRPARRARPARPSRPSRLTEGQLVHLDAFLAELLGAVRAARSGEKPRRL